MHCLYLPIKEGAVTEPGKAASYDAHHKKTDLKVFVVVIPKEGWALCGFSLVNGA